MPTVPAPCTNCLRFHYGTCHEAPKQCRECGGFNHIERYCPNKNVLQELLESHFQARVSGVKCGDSRMILSLERRFLRLSRHLRGVPFWVNGQCIYQGNESHFRTSDIQRGRGRPLEDRITRVRSRSPPRDRREDRGMRWRGRQRSRSPLRRYSPHDQRRLSRVGGRSPSPYRRRSPSPYRQPHQRPRSPRHATGSNTVLFEAKQENIREPHQLRPVTFNNQQPKTRPPRYLSGPPLSYFKPAEDRVPLGDVSNRQVSGQQNLGAERPLGDVSNRQNSGKQTLVAEHRTGQENMGRPSTNAPERGLTPEASFVEDPEFVLGVSKGASENEICDAYQQRMWEIKLERMGDAESFIAADGSNLLDESVKILNAAKKQLVGY